MTDDLWGDLPDADAIIHPRTVLSDQANVLARKTNGVLLGDIELITNQTTNIEFYNYTAVIFSIVCPTLNNYRFNVLTVYYKMLEVYPANIVSYIASSSQTPFKAFVHDDESFKEAVKQIFSSERVRKAIAALLRDARLP